MFNPDQKITYLEDLPELEDRIQSKFIREFSKNPMIESGMYRDSPQQHPPQPQQQQYPPPQHPPPQHPPPQHPPQQHPPRQYPPPLDGFVEHYNSVNCVGVADHIENCPLCSKFYKKNNSVFFIIIGILLVLCILLIKKVLDMLK